MAESWSTVFVKRDIAFLVVLQMLYTHRSIGGAGDKVLGEEEVY